MSKFLSLSAGSYVSNIWDSKDLGIIINLHLIVAVEKTTFSIKEGESYRSVDSITIILNQTVMTHGGDEAYGLAATSDALTIKVYDPEMIIRITNFLNQ